ncbi:MAG TPA: energy transducer TonB [Puia sp.]|nr:energy transducer TonB [Puia sp.]
MKMNWTCLLLFTFCSAHAQMDPAMSDKIDSAIYMNPEMEASYPGGQSAWIHYLQRNLRYPGEARVLEVQGTVVIKFLVDSNGLAHETQVLNGPDELRAESIRVIEKVKRWTPGMYGGRKVNSWKIQPIGFIFETGSKSSTLLGKYPSWPMIDYSDRPVEEVRKRISDYLFQNNMDIKTDSSRGLIVSKKAKLSASYENEKGTLYFPDSYVVLETDVDSKSFRPRRPDFFVLGDWFIKVEKKGVQTSIKISLLNIRAFGAPVQDQGIERNNIFNPDGRTTGVFENMIFEKIR